MIVAEHTYFPDPHKSEIFRISVEQKFVIAFESAVFAVGVIPEFHAVCIEPVHDCSQFGIIDGLEQAVECMVAECREYIIVISGIDHYMTWGIADLGYCLEDLHTCHVIKLHVEKQQLRFA